MKNFESADASVCRFKVFWFLKARLTGRPEPGPLGARFTNFRFWYFFPGEKSFLLETPHPLPGIWYKGRTNRR